MRRLIFLLLAVSLFTVYNTIAWSAGAVSEKTVIQGQYSGDNSVVEQYQNQYIGPSVAGEPEDKPVILHDKDKEWFDVEGPAKTDVPIKKWKPEH